MYRNKIPKTSVYRLAIYLRELERLALEEREYVSSKELGEILGIDPAQLRKDFSFFGQFGEVGRGYRISSLIVNLKKILKLYRKVWEVALVGVGNLGSALLSYKGFKEVGFYIRIAFDQDPKKTGQTISGIKVYHAKKMVGLLRRKEIKIGIICVPASSAQEVAEKMVRAGIKSILNFAPIRLKLPADIIVKYVDLSTELLSLPYYIS